MNLWWAMGWIMPNATAILRIFASSRGSESVLSSQRSSWAAPLHCYHGKTMGSVLSKREKHVQVDPLLLEVSDVMATSLDLDTTLRRVAEVVRKVIDYEIFAILLLNEKTQELRFRFQVGYPSEFAERARIKVGEGVTGEAVQLRQAVLIDDVTKDPRYIEAVPNVRSELAI